MFRSAELEQRTLQVIEHLLESVDVYDIADFIENTSDFHISRDDVISMANEILDELEHVKFTIN